MIGNRKGIVWNTFNTGVPFSAAQVAFIQSCGSFCISEERYQEMQKEKLRYLESQEKKKEKPDEDLSLVDYRKKDNQEIIEETETKISFWDKLKKRLRIIFGEWRKNV